MWLLKLDRPGSNLRSSTNWLCEPTPETTLIKSTKTSKNPTDTFQILCDWNTLNHLVQMIIPFFFFQEFCFLSTFLAVPSQTLPFLSSKYWCFSEFWTRHSFLPSSEFWTRHSFPLTPFFLGTITLSHGQTPTMAYSCLPRSRSRYTTVYSISPTIYISQRHFKWIMSKQELGTSFAPSLYSPLPSANESTVTHPVTHFINLHHP